VGVEEAVVEWVGLLGLFVWVAVAAAAAAFLRCSSMLLS